MGTRADFYIGQGQNAEWLGSVAWDGYEWAQSDCALMSAKTGDDFRVAVASIKLTRSDFTSPANGWPWPWDDSKTTDYSYVLHEGKVTVYCFGREIVGGDNEGEEEAKKVDWFPDMSDRKNVAFGDKSGLIVLHTK